MRVIVLSRQQADAVLYEAAGSTGPGIEAMGWFKRQILWAGIRVGGFLAWRTGPARFQRLRNDQRRSGSMPRRGGARREDQLVDLVHAEWRRRHPEAP